MKHVPTYYKIIFTEIQHLNFDLQLWKGCELFKLSRK